MMQIRKMTRKDCQEVFALQRSCFSTPWSLQSIQEMFHVPGYLSLIAEEQGVIIGYIGMKAVLDEADITNVAVAPDRRQEKIGTKLLKTLLEESGKIGVTSIFLEVRMGNTSAIRLYEQGGFTQIGIRKNYYEKPTEDALLMMIQIEMHPCGGAYGTDKML